ncbi:hypothetical protein AaE_007733, partial [Aphanomyces astaci]
RALDAAAAVDAAAVDLGSFPDRASRIPHIRSHLIQHMQTSQQQVIEFLQKHPEALDVRVERFHIANNLHMFGATSDLLDKLTTFDRVHRIQTPFDLKVPAI